MTKLMEEAIEKVRQLPPEDQDAIAEALLELESERRWEELFAKSQDKLAKMADDARRASERGETEPLDLDRL